MAISIFGHLGGQTETLNFENCPPPPTLNRRPLKPTGLVPFLLETSGSLLESAVSSLMIWFWAVLRFIFKTSNAHRMLVLGLLLSVGLNCLHSYHYAQETFSERKAANFMNRLGVTPNGALSKAIYIRDVDAAIAPVTEMETHNSSTW
jgi:hypothetical protein